MPNISLNLLWNDKVKIGIKLISNLTRFMVIIKINEMQFWSLFTFIFLMSYYLSCSNVDLFSKNIKIC